MAGNSRRGNSKRKGAPPPELGEAARTPRRTFYYDPEILKALDNKECLLEVQASLVGRLAAEENHIKGLVETFEPSDISFDERVKEVEEAIQAMQY